LFAVGDSKTVASVAELLCQSRVVNALPDNVRFVLTSRDERLVGSMYNGAAARLLLHGPENDADLLQFCRTRMWCQPLFGLACKRFPGKIAKSVDSAVAVVLKQAGGNFLALSHILNASSQQDSPDKAFAAQAAGLQAHYFGMIRRLYDQADWAVRRTVLELLVESPLESPPRMEELVAAASLVLPDADNSVRDALRALGECVSATQTVAFRHSLV
jgi:hypothetical protein